MLGIPHLVIAVNKMDLVDWSEERFLEIREAVEDFLPKLDVFKDVKFIPMSALHGDNVVEPSKQATWFEGPTLLRHLETVHIASDWNLSTLRFPVQWVNRPNNPTDHDWHDFRGLSGQIAGGIVKVGQKVMVLPSGLRSTVKGIWTYDGKLDEAFCPQSVTLQLEDDIDVSRGDMIVGSELLPGVSVDLQARICWMAQKPLQANKKFFLKHSTQTVQTIVTGIESKLDIHTFDSQSDATELTMNDIGIIRLRTARPLVYDGYGTNRSTGAFVLVEQGTNATVAAGMLKAPLESFKPELDDFTI
jgi:bifunctional enzyme CysN/CysC/sulfate adenylyltransferase subunit 1